MMSEPFTANTVAGSYSVSVSVDGGIVPSLSFNLTNVAGPPTELLVSTPQVTGPTGAGSGFLVAVQVADQYGNPVLSYSGPASATATISPTSTASDFPGTVAINSSGLGLFLSNIQKPGTYTITVANSSFTGSAAPVTVVPGPVVQLAFGVQPVNTPTGVTLPAVTVQVEDQYGNVFTGDNTDKVTLQVASGPGSLTTDSTTTATVTAGVATFNNLTLAVPGTFTLGAVVPMGYTGPNSSSFTVLPLQVLPASFVSGPSGFSLQFNAPILLNSVTPALYGTGHGKGAAVSPTVTLTQMTGTPPMGSSLPYQVPGSVILNSPDNGVTFNSMTFLETDTSSVVNNSTPLLPDGIYVVDITSSGANGLQALDGGGYLDGMNTGTPGDDFRATFTVGAGAASDDVVWASATADGPGQPLSAPGSNQKGGGYPLYLDDTTGKVTNAQLTLNYDPTLLTVTGVRGAGFSLLGSSTPGHAVLQYSGPALQAGRQTPIGFLTATVPSGTAGNPVPYRAQDLLHLSSVSLNGGAVAGVTCDGLHLVAYVGDANGDGTYSGGDALLITRVGLQTDTGFAAYPRVDPVIVADTDGSGFTPADAALQVNEAGVGVPTANLAIPPVPTGVHFQAIAINVDPTLSVGPAVWGAGRDGTVAVTLPVNIDDADSAGSTGLIQAHLALTCDPRQFTVSAADIHLGSLLAGSGWSLVPTIDPASRQIGIALSGSTPVSAAIGGTLVTIDLHPTGQISTPSSIDLVPSASPHGQPVSTELEDAQGTFTLTFGSTASVISPAPSNGGNRTVTKGDTSEWQLGSDAFFQALGSAANVDWAGLLSSQADLFANGFGQAFELASMIRKHLDNL